MGASKTWRKQHEERASRRTTRFGLMLRYLAIGVLALAWGATVLPRNTSAADDAEAFIQGIGDQVIKVLQQNLPPEKVGAQLNAIWLQAFDVQGIGRAVLGKNWGRASGEQRKAYMELFPKYVAKLYAIQFSDYSGETFAVNGSKSVPDGTVVNAEINQPRGEPFKLDFIVANTGQGLKVADVKVEGVSLLVTKRSEFDAVVAQKGIDGLIQAMRQKVSEESN
jgi:phospholipid transport system substrate-binding protein